MENATLPNRVPPQTAAATVEAITSLELEINSLKTHLNTFAAINTRLPTEILSDVFLRVLYFEVQCWRGTTDDLMQFHTYHWMKCCSVCRHWRQVALQCSTLWSYIFVNSRYDSTSMLRTFVARSRQTALHVFVNNSPYGLPDRSAAGLVEVLSEIHRIQELCIPTRLGRYQLQQLQSVSKLGPALLLTHLTLNGDSLWDIHSTHTVLALTRRTEPTFPFASNLPRLSVLKFWRAPLHEADAVFASSLTQLTMDRWRPTDSVSPLLHVLKRLVRLQYLSLTHSFSHDDVAVAKDAETVQVDLPDLRHLIIFSTGQSGYWVQLLDALAFPQTTQVSFISQSGSDMFMPVVMSNLKNRLTFFNYNKHDAQSPCPFSSMYLRLGRTAPGRLGLWNEHTKHSALDHEPTFDQGYSDGVPSLTVTWKNTNILDMWSAVNSRLDGAVRGVRYLFCDQYLSHCDLADTLRGMVHLQTLCVHQWPDLPSALQWPLIRTGDSPTPYFPNLKVLAIFHCTAYTGEHEAWMWWDALIAPLSARAKHGSLEKVILFPGRAPAKISAEVLAKFDGVVEVLECRDGAKLIATLKDYLPDIFVRTLCEDEKLSLGL
ncbi:hypothetical protein EIP91_007790 [Steccherinum ochraceum]|uniref:Uncharacterized protein n=1 Tax=Steccherinum ochraceum TaxID=92696 RepID=A0A4R0R656_9APHY|nr:hypothetical protein EIP91_007790 [Steccherinum ochraceum]